MDGPLFAAINAPVAEALLAYRSARLGAAKAIAKMNGEHDRLRTTALAFLRCHVSLSRLLLSGLSLSSKGAALCEPPAAASPLTRLSVCVAGYRGAYWPWQSAVTGFERSCENSSIAMVVGSNPRIGCVSPATTCRHTVP